MLLETSGAVGNGIGLKMFGKEVLPAKLSLSADAGRDRDALNTVTNLSVFARSPFGNSPRLSVGAVPPCSLLFTTGLDPLARVTLFLADKSN